MRTSPGFVEFFRFFSLLLLISTLIYTLPTITTEFYNDFENNERSEVSTFTIADNGVKATLKGGAIQNSRNKLTLSGKNSWIVESAGSNLSGIHSGSGTITFNVPMSHLSFWVRADSTKTTATVAIIDTSGNYVENNTKVQLSDENWTHINYSIADNAFALRSIHIEVKGTGTAALDNLYGTSKADVSITVAPPQYTPADKVGRYASSGNKRL